MRCSYQDEDNKAEQKADQYNGVDDGEPVDLRGTGLPWLQVPANPVRAVLTHLKGLGEESWLVLVSISILYPVRIKEHISTT